MPGVFDGRVFRYQGQQITGRFKKRTEEPTIRDRRSFLSFLTSLSSPVAVGHRRAKIITRNPKIRNPNLRISWISFCGFRFAFSDFEPRSYTRISDVLL